MYQGFQRVPCCLEVFKYLRASKKHSFVTPGICFFLLFVMFFFLPGPPKVPCLLVGFM